MHTTMTFTINHQQCHRSGTIGRWIIILRQMLLLLLLLLMVLSPQNWIMSVKGLLLYPTHAYNSPPTGCQRRNWQVISSEFTSSTNNGRGNPISIGNRMHMNQSWRWYLLTTAKTKEKDNNDDITNHSEPNDTVFVNNINNQDESFLPLDVQTDFMNNKPSEWAIMKEVHTGSYN